jgi:hypothetical protein
MVGFTKAGQEPQPDSSTKRVQILLQLDCDDLAVVLKDIIRKAKHFIMDAREAFICEKSVGFGFIKKGQYLEQ